MIATNEQPQVLTEADREEIVERIQNATRGMNREQLQWTIAAWEFMAADLRRVVALNGGAE